MKILIIRFSSFGDIVLTTPVIAAIKRKYPEAEIDFIVYTSFSQAISLNPNIRELILFEKSRSKDREYIGEMIEKLKRNKYDYVIDLHSKLLSRVIGRSLAGGKAEYLRYRKRKWWKTFLVKAKLIPYNADCTIVESYFSALKKLGIEFTGENIISGKGDALEFYIDESDEKRIAGMYNLKNRKYFVLAPGASKFTKKWPYYNELAKKIAKEKGLDIFVIGGPEDYGYVEEDADGKITNLCGKLSFKESAVVMKYADTIVVNDSGPFHIARALRSKIFVFFGPTDSRLFSFEKDTHLIYNEDCRPHSLYGDDKFPKKYENCMKDIRVDEVYAEIMSKYRG